MVAGPACALAWCEQSLEAGHEKCGKEMGRRIQRVFDFCSLDELEVQEFHMEQLLPTPLLRCRLFHMQDVCAVDVGILKDC